MTETAVPIADQDQAMSEAEKAGLRWRAIEVANSAEGLTAIECRVLVAMISVMDNETRECRPSEAWLASFLGVNLTSVKKAKAQLRDRHKLITWHNPGGPRHQSRYLFDWQKIIRLSAEAKARAREAVDERRSRRTSYGSAQTTNAFGSAQTTNGAARKSSKVASTPHQGSANDSQGGVETTSKVAPTRPDQPLISPYGSAQHSTPSGRGGALLDALKGKRSSPFTMVEKSFEDEPSTLDAYFALPGDEQARTSFALMTKGRDAARRVILGAATGESHDRAG